MIRVFTVVTRFPSGTTPLSTIPLARKHFCKARPASSLPIAPNVSTCAPSAARFAATFPAPPKHSLCETKSTTGTAASGESRVAVPHKYRSSIKSPSTPMRFPRNFGISFFKRDRYSARLVGIRSRSFLVLTGFPSATYFCTGYNSLEDPLLTIHYPLFTFLYQSSPHPATSPEYRPAPDKPSCTSHTS